MLVSNFSVSQQARNQPRSCNYRGDLRFGRAWLECVCLVIKVTKRREGERVAVRLTPSLRQRSR